MSILIGEMVVSMHTLIYRLVYLGPPLIRHGKREANLTLSLLCNIKKLAVYICVSQKGKQKEKNLLSKEMPVHNA